MGREREGEKVRDRDGERKRERERERERSHVLWEERGGDMVEEEGGARVSNGRMTPSLTRRAIGGGPRATCQNLVWLS